MKKLFSLIALLSFSILHAQELCPPEDADIMGQMLKVVKKVEDDDPFKKLYEQEKNSFKNSYYMDKPSQATTSYVHYNFPPLVLQPGEAVYMKVPENLAERNILFMILGHRQDPSKEKGWDAAKEWDSIPGLVSVQVNECSPTMKSNWRYWDGMSSGKQGAKFAEVKYGMELEGLYEWYKNGHRSVADDSKSHNPLCVNGLRIVNVGQDVVDIGQLGMKVSGPKASSYNEVNFSKSNQFGDYLTASGRQYGSRSDSVKLGGWGSSSSAKLPKGWEIQGSELSIEAPVGKKLSSLEVTIGDAKDDGSSGGAKLSAGVKKADGSIEWFIKNENVPPMGVLLGSPLDENYTLQKGDKIIIRSDNDESSVAGVRWGIQ